MKDAGYLRWDHQTKAPPAGIVHGRHMTRDCIKEEQQNIHMTSNMDGCVFE